MMNLKKLFEIMNKNRVVSLVNENDNEIFYGEIIEIPNTYLNFFILSIIPCFNRESDQCYLEIKIQI